MKSILTKWSCLTYNRTLVKKSIKRIVNTISKKKEHLGFETLFYNKKVVLLGPCYELTSELIKKIIESDVLVLINKGHRDANLQEISQYAKEIILFHCLNQSESQGGGIINSFDLRKKRIKYLCWPLSGERWNNNVSKYHQHNYALIKLFKANQEMFKSLIKSIKGFTPNTGYAAIWMIAKSGCKKMHISGINFYRAAYNKSYHEHLKDLETAIKHIENHKRHNPDEDFLSFLDLIENYPIEYDDGMKSFINKPFERLFYVK